MSLIVHEDAQSLVVDLAGRIEEWVAEAVEARGAAHLVLAGGSTPQVLHARLAERALPWEALHIYFGDERCVPPDHPDSNYRAAHETLLSKVPIPESQVHRMRGEDFAHAVAPYEALLPERFDVTLLGMGPDGHTASLFPGAASLEASERVLYIDDSPKPPPERVTLGLSALDASNHVVMMVTGEGKADALAGVLHPGDAPLPAARLRPTEGTLDYFVDRAAASKLEGV